MASLTPKVSFTGSGTVGEIRGGWSVSEDATPNEPGDTGASVGKVALSADRRDDSELINGNRVTTETFLGSVSGIVQSVTADGGTVSFSHDTLLGQFNASRVIPPVGSGHPVGALDMIVQMFGDRRCSLEHAGQKFWSLNGHDAGFDVNGNMLAPVDRTVGSYLGTDYIRRWAIRNSVSGVSWERRAGRGHVRAGAGFSVDCAPDSHSYVMVSRDLAGGGLDTLFSMAMGNSSDDTAKAVNVRIDLDALPLPLLTVYGTYKLAGVSTPFSVSSDLTPINLVAGTLQMVVDLHWDATGSLTVIASVANTADYGTVVATSSGLLVSPVDEFSSAFNLQSVRDLFYLHSSSSVALMGPYVNPLPFDVDIDGYDDFELLASGLFPNDYRPIIGGPMSAWDYLKQVGAGTAVEFPVINDRVTVRQVAGRPPIKIEEKVPARTTLNTQATARRIPVVNQRTELSSRAVVVDAIESGIVYEVNAGQVKKFTLQTETSAAFVFNPEHFGAMTAADWTSGLHGRDFGGYLVVDSNDVAITLRQWAEYRGSVSAMPGSQPGFVDVTLIGPRNDIPGFPGPYRFAVMDGATVVPAFTISGRGVLANPVIEYMSTGADPSKVSQETAGVVRNVAIGSRKIMYNRASWTAHAAGLGKREQTLTLAIKYAQSLGFMPGSLIERDYAIWRVVSDTVHRSTVDVTLQMHTVSADFEAAWADATAEEFEAFWEGNDASDFALRPLWKALYPSDGLYPSETLYPED